MKNAEYCQETGCPQRDSAEHEEYAGAQSTGTREVGERDGARLLEAILSRGNLNNAYKRVRANGGAPGIDGMTVEDALPWLREHREELLEAIRQGKYKPQPVRRKEIPKPDGGVRKLGIPTVVDRIIQQAIAQQLTPIYEPLFSDLSYGYRPGRSAQMAIQKVKEYAEQGYTQAVLVDLSKYFDTLNHELLMNLLRKNIHDKRVIELIKRYLKAGVMENGLLVKTEEGSLKLTLEIVAAVVDGIPMHPLAVKILPRLAVLLRLLRAEEQAPLILPVGQLPAVPNPQRLQLVTNDLNSFVDKIHCNPPRRKFQLRRRAALSRAYRLFSFT